MISHKSLVFVSDEISHSSGTVMAFIDKLVPALKTNLQSFTIGPTPHQANIATVSFSILSQIMQPFMAFLVDGTILRSAMGKALVMD